MNNWRLQSSTGRVLFKAFLTGTDTPATGKTIAVTLSKNGGAFGNPNAGASNATEIANGWYYFAPAAQDRDTLGPVVWRGTEGTIDPSETEEFVVDAVRLGITALPNAAADAAGGLPISDAGGLDLDARLDAAVSSRASSTQATNIETDTQDIQARLPAALSGGRIIAEAQVVGDKTGYALTAGERTAIANEVEAQIIDDTDSEKVLQAIVDKIAAANPSLDDLTLGAIASAVRTELATELARIDVAISTRLATAGYTVPPTAPANATAVRAELAVELARIDAAVTSRASAAQATAIEADTQDIQARLPAALVGGRIAAIAEVVSDKTGYALTAGERTAIVTALFAAASEGAETFIESFRIMRAALAGKSNSHQLGTPAYRDLADTKNRIAATTDANGNRTAVVVDGA